MYTLYKEVFNYVDVYYITELSEPETWKFKRYSDSKDNTTKNDAESVFPLLENEYNNNSPIYEVDLSGSFSDRSIRSTTVLLGNVRRFGDIGSATYRGWGIYGFFDFEPAPLYMKRVHIIKNYDDTLVKFDVKGQMRVQQNSTRDTTENITATGEVTIGVYENTLPQVYPYGS